MPSPIPPQDPKLRAETVRNLLHLEQQKIPTGPHRKLVAQVYGVDEKTVKRWMDNARAHDGVYTPAQRQRFTLTANMVDELAIARGNINVAYKRLTAHPYADDPPLPCLATFYKAVHAEFSKAMLDGLRWGERARRRYDVHGQEIFDYRNQVWEGDHVQASVWVNVEGQPVKPWITWFIDGKTKAVPGKAITPGFPSSGSIMAAVRSALARGGHHGPFGGRPQTIRTDRGADFLSSIVGQAFANLGVPLQPLPPKRPDRKGTIEGLNSAVKSSLFQSMPGFVEDDPSTKRPRIRPSGSRKPADVTGLMPFEAFVTRVEQWIHDWNHTWSKRALSRRTPGQAWNDDLTVIFDVDVEALHAYTLAGPDRPLKITTKGVHWNNNRYIAPWMKERDVVGTTVMLRHMPNQDREVELYDAATGKHLGSATATDQASPQLRREVRLAAEREAAKLARMRKRADEQRVERYSPVTNAESPQHAHAMSQEQAVHHLRNLAERPSLSAPPHDLLPLPAPSPSWSASPEQQPHEAVPQPQQQDPAEPLLQLPRPTPSWATSYDQPPIEPAHLEAPEQ
jgi:putative transposase